MRESHLHLQIKFLALYFKFKKLSTPLGLSERKKPWWVGCWVAWELARVWSTARSLGAPAGLAWGSAHPFTRATEAR